MAINTFDQRDDRQLIITDPEIQAVIDSNEPEDIVGVERDLQARILEIYPDSLMRIRVLGLDPFSCETYFNNSQFHSEET